MIVKDLTNKIIDKILDHVQTPDNLKKIQLSLLDPLITYTYRRMYPYFMMIIIIFLLTFFLALLILIILIRKIIINK